MGQVCTSTLVQYKFIPTTLHLHGVGNYYKHAEKLLNPLVNLLLSSTTVCICIFVNFVSECSKWAKILENLLADKLSSTAVEVIHGDMDRNEKFGFVKIYISCILAI